MRTDTPKTIYLKDYQPYPFKIHVLDLNFDIHAGYTVVTASGQYERLDPEAKDIFLYGEDLELLSLKIDGQDVEGQADDKSIRIPCSSDRFELEIVTKIIPEQNTRLEGLYMSGGNYCTQCEAEGFRRITYFPDRPDVLTAYTVRVEADEMFPVLLSNGNKTEEGKADNGRHYTIWHDPFPKPCYLFALVAGDLTHIHDTYTTKSGREVDLYIYVRPGDEAQCDHAMESLKRSMKWDEDVYGLEYDLDIFNIVAVSDFNMGAMENKSLNIFNTALVLAAQETATDSDFMRVESVIAHEYFHNWSGNRVTCRDWFQLSLKEGLTVFRDQEFSADHHSRAVQRIDDVTHLRRLQFPEDAGPLAHPIRPDNYIEINNFYTMTVYEKGAEVIRMIRTILGDENYYKGTTLYFDRHDGDAATCDDFIQCMQDASGIDLSHFKLWYSQAGTPDVAFKGEYDADKKTYTVNLVQDIPDTPGQSDKKPMHIPVSIGLLGQNGEELIEDRVLDLEYEAQSFVIEGVTEHPVPSVLRNFSAPVRLQAKQSTEELSFLMLNDSDGFNKWEAGQTLYLQAINDMIEADSKDVPAYIIDNVGAILNEAQGDDADLALFARMLSLPSLGYIGQQQDVVDPTKIYKARQNVLKALKRAHRSALDKLYKATTIDGGFDVTPQSMGRRALRNTVLEILTCTYGTGCASRSKAHYDNADNMTDRVAALSVLTHMNRPEREEVFEDFYNRYKNYPLVVDKWFSLQAISTRKDLINDLNKLKEHADFNIKNPNRVRSLYAAFAMNNTLMFHVDNGDGYRFLTDAIIELNSVNPQIAARLLTPMREWKRYTPDRQEKMKACLQEIIDTPELSPDVFEIASKSLKA